MTNQQYQQNELKRFYAKKTAYYDNVKDFAEWLDNTDILQQIEWIENGTYGAGECFYLQRVLNGITPRCNAMARIGGAVLSIFYGKDFRYWNKLTKEVQAKMTAAVTAWMRQEHNFADTLED
jgi:hypothetical protein